jgi:cyclase
VYDAVFTTAIGVLMLVTRRSFVVRTSLSAAALALAPQTLVGQQAAAAGTTEAVRRNVGVFTGRGGTIGWLSTPDATVVVDTQFPDTATVCLDALAAKGRRQVDVLLNTHHHGDHTGGNAVFRPVAKLIVAHARVPALQKQAAAQQQGGAEPVVADTTFDRRGRPTRATRWCRRCTTDPRTRAATR